MLAVTTMFALVSVATASIAIVNMATVSIAAAASFTWAPVAGSAATRRYAARRSGESS